MKRTIIVSGINLVDGGTYTIMKECLDAISNSPLSDKYRVIALVHKNGIFRAYSNIEMMEFPKSKKNYLLRFYYEYYKFRKISKLYKPRLWLSLHDMSPIVNTEIQAVYMHNPSPFLGRPKSFSLRGIAFSSFYKYIYRINIHSNDYLIVQQNWIRESFSEMFGVPQDKIIVARPASQPASLTSISKCVRAEGDKVFVYASYPREFKNFELICEAARILENKGIRGYGIRLTIDECNNGYAKKLVEKYSGLKNLHFVGLQPREMMNRFYSESDCMIFPSKLETWGLPISEYSNYGKPMILADLPYAHETAAGAAAVSFIDPNNEDVLARRMIEVLNNDYSNFDAVPVLPLKDPQTYSWEELFKFLLKEK